MAGRNTSNILTLQNHKKQQNTWIPLVSNQRETLESHFLRASAFWLYKYQPSPLQSLWVSTFMAERETEGASYWPHKTPSLSHWSSFIHWLTSLGTGSLDQSDARGFLERSSPAQKRHIPMFSSPLAKLTDWGFWQHMFTETYLFQSLFIHWRFTDNVCSFPALLPQLGAAHTLLYSATGAVWV